MRAIYSIEGNIGSGKSTFLNLIKEHVPAIHVIPEPVAEWQHISSEFNLLDLYYRNPQRWAFTFQINAILSRMKELRRLFQLLDKQTGSQKVFFSERSIVADRQIFAKLLHKDGKMNDLEHALYLNMYNSLQNLFQTPKVHRFIYLKSSPEKCMQRMLKRARHEQLDIKLEYLKKIHQLHEQWLGDNKNAMVIEGEDQFQSDPRRMKEMVNSVQEFLTL